MKTLSAHSFLSFAVHHRFLTCGSSAAVTVSSGTDTRGAFHLVKNSENSGSGLNGKRFSGSPDRKIPRKSGTTETTF